jgi:hypothetical protein
MPHQDSREAVKTTGDKIAGATDSSWDSFAAD